MRVSESIKYQQELIHAKNRLDEEVRTLKLIHKYSQRSLSVSSLEEFGELTIEAFIEVFNEAKGIFLYCDQSSNKLQIVGHLDLIVSLSEDEKNDILINLSKLPKECEMIDKVDHIINFKSYLNLKNGYISPIIDATGEMRGLIIIGQSEQDSLFYKAPCTQNFFAFNLMIQNVGLLLNNIRFQDEIKHELQLTKDLTKSLTEQKNSLAVEKTELQEQVVDRNVRLERANELLKKEIGLKEAIEIELRRQKEELQRSNEDLSQFASVISHDLKTPLRNVMGFTKLLQHNYAEQLDIRGNEYLRFVYDGVKQFGRIIDDLLEFSQVTKGQISKSTIDLNEVLENIENSLRKTIQDNDVIINRTKLPSVIGDEIQLYSLLKNLLENALKYRSHKRPIININTTLEDGAHTISISDNGIGIHKEYQEKIFKLFERLHHTNDYEGTGIGLTISKKIVERHGGKIWLESKENVGTTFYFSIPAD